MLVVAYWLASALSAPSAALSARPVVPNVAADSWHGLQEGVSRLQGSPRMLARPALPSGDINRLSSINDEQRNSTFGADHRRRVRQLVPGPGGRDADPDRVTAGPPGDAHECRRNRRRGRGRPVHRVGPPEGAGGGGLRPCGAARDLYLLPDQRRVRRLLSHRCRHRHGPASSRSASPAVTTLRSTPMTTDSAATAGDAIIGRYSALARTALDGGAIADCDPEAFEGGQFGAAAYASSPGAPEVALRASLGCGNPVAVADLQPGETVLDLGSGGGLDVLLSARRVGPSGTAYGLDASNDMLALARANAAQAGVANAEFLHGHIEDIPLPGEHIDVIISNCVINLSADKARVLAEAFRVLRPGGRLGISDLTADNGIDLGQRAGAEQRVGCISGTLTQPEYRGLLLAAGFTNISITSTHEADVGLHSVIIQAAKPATRSA